MIIQINNFFPILLQKKILKIISSPNLAWYHRPSLKNKSFKEIEKICEIDMNIILGQGFIHTFYDRDTEPEVVDGLDILSTFIIHTEKHFDLKITKVLRLQALQVLPYPSTDTNYMMPHVDYMFPHKTLLYYVNNTQGDTFIFNEKSDLNSEEIKVQELYNLTETYSNKTLKEKISPVQGKAVLFNGLYYHAASFPKINNRYVINFNFL